MRCNFVAVLWGIPIARVAGVLTLSYTGTATTGTDQPEAPLQRPTTQQHPPELPPAPPLIDASEEPAAESPFIKEPETADEAVQHDPGESPLPPSPLLPPLPDPRPPPNLMPVTPSDAPLPPGRDLAPLDTEAPPDLQRDPEARRDRGLLAPTDRRRFFTLGVGGGTPTSPYAAYLGNNGLDFQWELAIGAYGKRRPRFGGAFVFQHRRGLARELTFAGRLLWDRKITKAFALYSTINFDFGVNTMLPPFVFGYSGYGGYGFPATGLLGVGWSLRAILAKRLIVGLRPLSANLCFPSYNPPIFVQIRWDVVATFGVVW